MPTVTKPWQSKTLWINLAIAVTCLVSTSASEWLKSHVELAMAALSGVNMLLRLVTKDKIGLTE